MSELAERDEKGLFLPGNLTGKKGGNPLCGKVMALKAAVLQAADPETVQRVMGELLAIALNDSSSKVRIQAAVAWLERVLGRPKEHVELDVTTDAPAVDLAVDLDASDIQALERIRLKRMGRLVAPAPAPLDAVVIDVDPERTT